MDDALGLLTQLRGLLGLGLLIALCVALSLERGQIRWRPVLWGLGLQLLLALIFLSPGAGALLFRGVNVGINALFSFAEAGISFVLQATQAHQVAVVGPDGQVSKELVVGQVSPMLKSLALTVLPSVIFFSALTTISYHLGVMQLVVGGLSRLMVRMMRTSGAETLSATANVVLGMTEGPLLVKPFIERMTPSELLAVMVGGFATLAGGVLVVYASFLTGIPDIAGHLVAASLMAAPGSLAVSKILLPETGHPETGGGLRAAVERPDHNLIEAAARGASEGMVLVINIVAVVLAFVGLIALVNGVLGLLGVSLQQILGWLLSPLVWSLGIPWGESTQVSWLLGEKLILTEFLAYSDLKTLIASGAGLAPRTAVITVYLLCGFASLPAVGIEIGGIGGMAPSRRGELARFGLRAMAGGALVSAISGSMAGLFV